MLLDELAIVPVSDPRTCSAAESLIREYLQFIADTASAHYALSFDITAMVASDIEDRCKFYPPSGRFYLVEHAGQFIGVGCLKRLEPTIAEIQRMYVLGSARGLGAGRLLVEQLLVDARDMKYRSVRLESLKILNAAHALYRSVGFKDIDPYSNNSMKAYQSAASLDRYHRSAVFMEREL